MNCPTCGHAGYFYDRHNFWQCQNPACAHSWAAEATPTTVNLAEPFPGMFPPTVRPGWERRSREELDAIEARQRRDRAITSACAHAANAQADFKRLHPDTDFAARVDAWFKAGCELADEIPREVQDA